MSEVVAAEAVAEAQAEVEVDAAEVVGDLLGDISHDVPEKAEAQEPEPEPEKPATEAKPSGKLDKGKEFLNPALFTPEALATPEGIIAAQKAVQTREEYTRQVYLRTVDRSKNARASETNAKAWEDRARVLHESIHADLAAVRNAGTTDAKLAALTRFFGRSAIEVYEELTDHFLGQRKNKPDANAEMKRELAELKQSMQAQGQQAQQREALNENARLIAQIESQIATEAADAEKYPNVAHFATGAGKTQEIVEYTKSLQMEHWAAQCGGLHQAQSAALQAGNQGMVRACIDAINGNTTALRWLAENHPGVRLPQALDRSAALSMLNDQLAAHAEEARGQTGTIPDAGRATSLKPKPVVGKSVSPNRASAASSRRSIFELNDEERFAELLRDPGDLLNQLGI